MTSRRWSTAVPLAALLASLIGAGPAAADPQASASLFGRPGVPKGAGKAAGAAAPGRPLHLSLLLRADDAGLTRYATAVSTPGSPLFGKHLSAKQVLQRFGPSRTDRRRAAAWLRRNSLPVRTAPGGFALDTVVTVAQAQRLFSTRIAAFRSARGGRFVAPVRSASLPAALNGAVVGVNGLSDRQVAYRSTPVAKASQAAPVVEGLQPLSPEQSLAFNEKVRATGSSIRANLGTQAGCEAGRSTGTPVDSSYYIPAYTPNQYLGAYGVSRLHGRGLKGQGQRVALIEIDGFSRSDLTTAASCFGFRAPPTTVVPVGGTKQPLPPGPENTLDLQVLGAAAPGLKEIIVYQGTPTSYALNKQYASAVALPSSRRPSVISSSIGICEIGEYGDGPYVRQLERTFKQAAAEGITVVAASGDTGSTGCAGEGNASAIALPSAGFPASSPWVTGVGGTNFTLDSRNRITEEVVWNNAPISFGAGNGGPSLMFRQPSWQQGPGIDGETGARWVPDIAMLADTQPGYSIYCTASETCDGLGWIPIGGTSAATPLLGGILALANQQAKKAGQPRLGHINPLVYKIAGKKSSREDVFRDVTKVGNDLGVLIGPANLGNNQPVGCCTAKRYYDLASGWGSVRAPEFSSALRSAND